MLIKRLIGLILIILFIGPGAGLIVSQEDGVSDRVLSSDATLNEIISALRTAHKQYKTLYVKMTTRDHLSNVSKIDEIWLSAIQGAFRWKTTTIEADGEISEYLEITDGKYVSTSTGSGERPLVMLIMMKPENVAKGWTSIAPEVIANQLSEPDAKVEVVGVEMMALADQPTKDESSFLYMNNLLRETIKVTYASKWGGDKLWVDTETGVVIRDETWSHEGQLISTVTIDAIEFDPVIVDPATFFYVDHSAYDPEWISSFFETGLPQTP